MRSFNYQGAFFIWVLVGHEEVELKLKTMSFNETNGVQRFDWNTLKLGVNQRPDWMKNIPEHWQADIPEHLRNTIPLSQHSDGDL